MPCYYPLEGWRAKNPNENGRYPIVFEKSAAQQDAPIRLPCGKCIGCRLERSRQWAIRCIHEQQLHDDNCFITLTYDPEHMPQDHSISKREWQLFLKKFRKKIAPKKIRFFACGEYGIEQNPLSPNKLGRPHYHAIIFNYDFADKELHNVVNDNKIYTSETLDKIWGKGFCTIGDVTFESSAYVARYIMKKITGDMADDHYQHIDELTGEIYDLEPEFTLQSRNPGIASAWYQKYKTDLNKGFITVRGIKMSIPKYYETLIEREEDERLYDRLKERKRVAVDYDDPENQIPRLRVKEKIKVKKSKQLKREIK